MNRRPDNLNGRIVKLEGLYRRRPRDNRFFLIWGRDEADLAQRLAKAKADGDLLPGDRFESRIWSHASAPPPPRRTALHEVNDEELRIIAGGGEGEVEHPDPSIACQWTDAELSEFYANSLEIFDARA
jgi:hypothetical protein